MKRYLQHAAGILASAIVYLLLLILAFPTALIVKHFAMNSEEAEFAEKNIKNAVANAIYGARSLNGKICPCDSPYKRPKRHTLFPN